MNNLIKNVNCKIDFLQIKNHCGKIYLKHFPGIFVSRSVKEAIEKFSNSSNIPLYSLDYSPNLDTLMQISVQLLMELNYSSIDLAVFPNSDLLQQFNKLTVSQNICVEKSYTFSQYNG